MSSHSRNQESPVTPSETTTFNPTYGFFEDAFPLDDDFSISNNGLFGGNHGLNLDEFPFGGNHGLNFDDLPSEPLTPAPTVQPEVPHVNAIPSANVEDANAVAPHAISSFDYANGFQPLEPEMPSNMMNNILQEVTANDLLIQDFLAKHDVENNVQANSHALPTNDYANELHAVVPSEAPRSPERDAGFSGPVEAAVLQFSSESEAREATWSRRKLELQENEDDHQLVEENSASYVRRIIAAFEGNLISRPAIAISEKERVRWVNYQRDHADKAATTAKAERFGIEPFAWFLLGEVLGMHKKGVKKTKYTCDRFVKCSDRVDAIIDAISDYAIIRCDVLGENFDALVASPKGAIARKASNWRGNRRKVNRDEDNQKVAAAANLTGFKSVLGDGTKRKLNSTDSSPGSSSDCQSTPSKKRKSKSTGPSTPSDPIYLD